MCVVATEIRFMGLFLCYGYSWVRGKGGGEGEGKGDAHIASRVRKDLRSSERCGNVWLKVGGYLYIL